MARNENAAKAAARIAAAEVNAFVDTVNQHGLGSAMVDAQAGRTNDALALADRYGATNDEILAARRR